jgi:PII-like signaling protein
MLTPVSVPRAWPCWHRRSPSGRLSEDLPVGIVIVDAPDNIDALLPLLDDLIDEGLVVREQVEVSGTWAA